MLTFIAGFAAVFGTAEGVRAAQSKSRREEHRSRKNNLVVHCPKSSKSSAFLEGRAVVLAGEKVGPPAHEATSRIIYPARPENPLC